MRRLILLAALLFAAGCRFEPGEVVSGSVRPLGGAEKGRPATPPGEPRPDSLNCMQQTVLKEMVITLDDARKIQAAANRYLVNSKLQKPEPLFIDCQGTVRMGAWILERSNEKGALRLAVRTVWTEHLIVRQEMRIKQINNRWTATGMGEVIYHGRRY